MTVFLANEGIHYRYSGAIHTGCGWPEWFKPLLHQVNEACETHFNVTSIERFIYPRLTNFD